MNEIKKRRIEIGATQKSIAQKLKISERQYQGYEYKVLPRVDKAIKIAKALNSTCEELWGEEEKAHTAM